MNDDLSQKGSITRLGALNKGLANNGVPMRIPLDKLVPYSRQARKTFNAESIKELAAGIQQDGLLNPLTVRPQGSQYEIIGGERRWRAARLAGLTHIPVLVRTLDDEEADRIHLRENIQRENLDTLELAERVHADVQLAGGDLAVVAAKFGKSKPWVSKFAAIGAGGASMQELIAEGVTSDQAVLASVASLERRAPERAKVLVEELKAAPFRASRRAIADGHLRKERDASKAAKSAQPSRSAKPGTTPRKHTTATVDEPAWCSARLVALDAEKAAVALELSPASAFADNFAQLQKKHGFARLSMSKRHPDKTYAIVQFGSNPDHTHAYRADELRLLSVR